MKRYDVFIFSTGTSFFPDFSDYPVIRENGKVIIHVFHGSDSRPPWMDGSIMASDRGRSIGDCKQLTEIVFQRVKTIEKFSHHIICNPASAQFFSKSIVNWFAVGVPTKVSQSRKSKTSDQLKRKTTILHSPSHPEAKGTSVIESVIQELNREGYNIKLIKIIDKPNTTVLKLLKEVDLAIDQLYSDTPLAGFASEAISQGTPVLVGSYFIDFIQSSVENVPPSNMFPPENLKSEIQNFIENPEIYEQITRDCQHYLALNWDRKMVAEKFIELACNTSSKMTFDPMKDGIVAPCVMSDTKFKKLIQLFHSEFGIQGMAIDTNIILSKQVYTLLN